MFHYVGTLKESNQVFDSTRGGLNYRDGGLGVLRPAIIKLGDAAVPGIVSGLTVALIGLKVGQTLSISVPPELGFGQQETVLAPYAIVPPGSTLLYEIELIRVSRRGIDDLMRGVSSCGAGFVMEKTEGCGSITYAEFL